MRIILVLIIGYLLIDTRTNYGMLVRTTVKNENKIDIHIASPHAASDDPHIERHAWGSYAFFGNTQSFIGRHKYTILIIGLLGGYSYLCYVLAKGNGIIKNGNAWSAWKRTIAFEELCQIPQQELIKDLLHDIQRQYINYKNPTDFISPLSSFADDLEAEYATLNSYLKIGSIVKKLYLSFLFPIDEDMLDLAGERLERLHFVQHLFVSWSAQHNLEQNNIVSPMVRKIQNIE